MGLFHTAMCVRDRTWTVKQTAIEFNVSIGLASENIQLAVAIDRDAKIMKLNTRNEALRKIR
jgi:hypothetical protein